MKKTLLICALALISLPSCRTYYAGYGKNQAAHRKCGQRNANSRLFGAEFQPAPTDTTFVTP